MRTFTDNEGNKYKLVTEFLELLDGSMGLSIKPIQPKDVDKHKYKLDLMDTQGDASKNLHQWLDMTKPQAEVLANTIETLVKTITDEAEYVAWNRNDDVINSLDRSIVRARKAFQEGSHD